MPALSPLTIAALSLHGATSAAADTLRFGSGVPWLARPWTGPAFNQTQPLFGDVDGNGTEDAVLYAYGRGEAYVAFSTGTSLREPVLYSIGLPSFAEPTFEASLAELNGDGKVDIVIMNHGADDVPGAATAVVAVNTGAGFQYPPENV
jgi:hypothetical protein